MQATLFTWEDGAVVPVGCQGAGDNNVNSDAHTMYFKGNGWIHGTYTPKANKPSGWAIWRNYLITNGTVVVEGVTDDTEAPPKHYGFSPVFKRAIVLGDVGRMIVSNAHSTSMFVGPDNTVKEYPLFDLKGLSFVDASGTACAGKVSIRGGGTFLRLPENVTVGFEEVAKTRLAVAGPDLLRKIGTNFKCKEIFIFSDEYIPEGGELTVGADTTLILSARTIDAQKAELTNPDIAHTQPWSDAGSYPQANHAVNLSGTLTLESTSECTFSGRITGQAATATIRLPGGLTHVFNDLAGELHLMRDSGDEAVQVTVNAMASGTRLFAEKNVTVDCSACNPAPVVVTTSDGEWYLMPDAATGVCDFTGIEQFANAASSTLSVDATYFEPELLGNSGVKVSPSADKNVTVFVNDSTVPQLVGGEGTINLLANACAKAVIWADPSRADRIYRVGETVDASKGGFDTTFTNDFHLIEAIGDVRSNHAGYWLRNNRLYAGGSTVAKFEANHYGHVYPYFVPAAASGPNGLAYMSCGRWKSYGKNYTYTAVTNGHQATHSGELRRMPVSNGTTQEGVTAGTVVMVFGSQYGGGAALIGEQNGAFDRQAGSASARVASDPIMTDGSYETWVDGVEVDPSKTGLNGGWQIVSVNTAGKSVTCFGWSGTDKANNDYNNAGGQNYGEILVFAEELSDAERVSVEAYLAAKWGITTYQRPMVTSEMDPAKAMLYGTNGTVNVVGSVRVSGTYGGDFVVPEGATLSVTGPYAPEIPSEGRFLWFDPDCAGAISYKTHHTSNAIHGLWQRGKTEQTTAVGELFLHGVNSRAAYAVPYARGFGKSRIWMEYENPVPASKQGTSDGNTMRIREWQGDLNDPSYQQSSSDRPQDVQTVFIVSDSIHGGGDPLRKSVSDGGDWGSRGRTTADKAIWSGAGVKVTGGATHLNGRTVDGTKTGYTGEAEVLSVRATASVKLCNFGCYTNTEGFEGFGERIGEILLYNSALSDEQMKTVDDYLLFKWTGIAPEGYGDFTAATVSSGSGTVRAKAADLPKFGDDFKGTIAVTDETKPTFDMAVTAADQPVKGALVAKGATLTGFTSATINVTVQARTYGDFVLVDAAGVGEKIAWTVNLSGGLSDSVKQAASVVVSEDGASVVLKLVQPGTMILIR